MATDNTHVLGSEGVSGDSSQEFNPEVVQVAAADGATGTAPAGNGQQAANQTPPIPGVPNGEVQVQVPAGETVVRVQVAPGETIDLPFDGALAAKFGEQGNLAIKLGDTTIILLGYAEANQQAGVTVKDDKGQAIDVATVVAQTDPNLDIQTAAGPAGGQPGGQGGHLFFGFAGGGGLGGFNELGVINPTELEYRQIAPDEKILIQGTSPDIINITIDNLGTVNEDDFGHVPGTVTEGGGETAAFSKGMSVSEIANSELGQQISDHFGNVHYGTYNNGNDPSDTDDHEDGSQTDGHFTDNNSNGIDQDREPLSVSAHIKVNFFNDVPGHLQFDNGGSTPVISYLESKNLTSHDHALQYELLPADGTHGETVVAYYSTGEGEGACTTIVFSLEIMQATGLTQISNFDLTFTIYGVLDNPGQGSGINGEDIFDIPTAFFAIDSDGTVTASPAGNLVFHDVDDVPQLGHYSYSTEWCPTPDGQGGEWKDIPTGFHTANLTIGLDETPGVQHTSYTADANNDHGGSGHDIGDIDPTGALGQHSDQKTDDVCMTQDEANCLFKDIVTDCSTNDTSVLGKIDPSFLVDSGNPACGLNVFMGAAQVCLDVSFGADGKADGKHVQSGQTLFDKDGDANATAFQLYMQQGAGTPAENAPKDCVLTNLTISVVGSDGCVHVEKVTAYQLDANTIIGLAPGLETNDDNTPREVKQDAATGGDGNDIPVFMLHLDPTTGELTLVQYHQVNNPDGCDPNDPIQIEDSNGNPLINFRATDFDGDYVDAPLSVAIIDDAPKICQTTYCSGNEVDEDFLNGTKNNEGFPGNHDKDTWPDNHDSPYGTDKHNDGDGDGHTHVEGQINASGVDVPFKYAFHVEGLTSAGDTVACFKDDLGNTVKSSDGHDIALNLSQSGCNWVITGSYVGDDNCTHDVFTLTLDGDTGKFDFCLLGALQHPDNGPGPITSYEDNLLLDFGIKVTDIDGDTTYSSGVGQGIQINVDDDQPRLVCAPVIDCTISSDPNPREGGTCLSESTCSVTVDTNNHPGWITISALDDAGNPATLNTIANAGFGVVSSTDGGNGGRFDEVNYTGNNTSSESLAFDFGSKLVESATVELARFYSNENGTDETGHWVAYKDGNIVAEGDFQANSASGQFGLAIPTVAGGFDKLVFTATNDAQFTHGDNSDYLVQELNLNLLPTDKQSGHFVYTYGADGGVLPTGNAGSEAGLGFQAHYTGGSVTSDGHSVSITEAVVGGHIVITATDDVTHLTVFTLDVNPGTVDSSTGQATATYTYTQYGPLDNNGTGSDLPFQFQITDRDGDAISTDICVCLKDAAPVGGDACADVFEKGLDQSGNSHDGTDKGDGSNATTGFLNFSYNGDGPGHITAVSAGDGSVVTQDNNGNWVVTNANYVLTIDHTTGYYTFTLLHNLQHANTTDDGYTNADGTNPTVNFADIITALGFNFTVTDADGTTADGTLTVKVHDDGPIVSACWDSDHRVILVTEDANTIGNPGFDTATGHFGALFSTDVNYGADGSGGSSVNFSLNLLTNAGADSGLTSAGNHIYLFNVGGTVYGTTDAGGATDSSHVVFKLTVNGSGDVTLTQYQELDHPLPGASSNYDSQSISLANGLVGLVGTYSATDGDGDTATTSATLDLGGNVKFEDDGPSVSMSTSSDADLILKTHDHLTIGNPGFDTATVDFSGVFHANVNYGADTPGTTAATTYALGFLGGTHNGSDSGLNSDGHDINLFNIGGTIFGSTANSAGGVNVNNTVFSISVDGTGHVTLTQYQEIDHPTPGSSSNYDGQSVALANGLVGLTASVMATDFDGDTDSASKTLDLGGNVKFADDGPAVILTVADDSNITLLTHDHQTIGSGSDTASASFASLFTATPTYGADTPGTTTMSYALTLLTSQGGDSGLNSGGNDIHLFNIGGTIYGSTANSSGGVNTGNTIFTVSVNGSGSVTLTQLQEIDHAAPGDTSNYSTQLAALANGLIGLVGTATATDFDHDTATASQTVDLGGNIKFADDGPSVTVSAKSDDAVTMLTHDHLTIGAASDTATGNFGALFSTNPNYGADTPGTTSAISYALGVTNGTDSGLKSDGHTIYLFNVSGTIYGTTDAGGATDSAHAIFSLSVSGSGVVTQTQYQEIDHPTPGAASNYDSQTIALGNGLVTLTGSATATDFDGDTATGSKTIDLGGNVKFADDGPSITVSAASDDTVIMLTHDHLTIGAGSDTATGSFGGLFTANANYGADAPGTTSSTSYALTLLVNGGSNSGLKSDGNTIYLYNLSGVITGSTSSNAGGVTAGNTVFSLSVDSTGKVTQTQYQEIDHPLPGDTSNYDTQSIALANGLVGLTGTATATDFDGDTATGSKTIDLGGNVKFADDGPTATADHFGTVTVQLAPAQAIGNILGNDSSGADGYASPKVITAVAGAVAEGNGFKIDTGDGIVHIAANGNVTFDSKSGDNYGNGTQFGFDYTIKDGDGDTSTAHADFSVKGSTIIDTPINYNDAVSVTEPTPGPQNVFIILDVSQSMDGIVPGSNPPQSRLEMAQAAITNMLAQYASQGNVSVIVEAFRGAAIVDAGHWTSAQAAADYVNNLTSNSVTTSQTNYEAAIIKATDILNNDTTGKIQGAPTTVYFISDGDPTTGGGANNHLTPGTETNWENALGLAGNNVSHVYSIGIGPDVSPTNTDLLDVAQPNSDNTPAGQVMIVNDINALNSTLAGTTTTPVTGNVLDGSDASGAAGDPAIADHVGTGPTHISTLTYHGLTLTWDGNAADPVGVTGAVSGQIISNSGGVVVFKTDYGTMTVYFQDVPAQNKHAGDFSFTPNSVNADKTETFHYVTTDSNGKTEADGTVSPGGVGADLVINIKNVPQMKISDAAVTEPTIGNTTTVTFHVTLDTVAGAGGATVHWSTVDGTATAGLDYVAASGDITFAAGETTKDITVTVKSDLLVEGDETFGINLSGAVNSVIVDGQGIGTIHDKTEPLTISGTLPDAYAATSSNSGGAHHTFGGINYSDTSTINQSGNSGHHYISDNNSDHTLQAGTGGDILVGNGGHDIFKGGVGNDSFVVTHDDLFSSADDSVARSGNIVDGNGGVDKLEFNFNLDTTKLGAGALSHLDVLDMNNGSNETLTLNYNSVTSLADNKQVIVQANSGDTVELKNDASNSWTATGVAVGSDGHNYVHYQAGSGVNVVNVLIDEHATVHIS